MKNMINFSEMGLTAKNSTKVKECAKKQLDDFILDTLKENYGEENVSEVFKDGNNMKGRAISVCMGLVDSDGFEIEVCVNVELTAKAITETTRKTTTGRLSTTEIYDRLSEAELYKQATEQKQKEKAEKQKARNAKKDKDNTRRERLKELAEAQKKAKEKQKGEEIKEEVKEGE